MTPELKMVLELAAGLVVGIIAGIPIAVAVVYFSIKFFEKLEQWFG